MLKREEETTLYRAAQAARRNAYAPYSHFTVGAALLTEEGKVYSGCNIENASFGLSVCAERVAVWKAVSEGTRRIKGLVLILSRGTPCGACRQVLAEFGNPEMPVIVYNDAGERRSYTLGELLPEAFSGELLRK